MPKKKNANSENRAELRPYDRDDRQLVQVVIETPKGSRNKYAFDPEQSIFQLKKVLPAGMAFPHDFGFIPSTRADDGDPVDVLVLMDEPVPTGCLVKCRLIGVIEGKQREKNKDGWIRNDRLIAVERNDHQYSDVSSLGKLDPKFLNELGEFFVNYHKLDGSEFRVLAHRNASAARKVLKKAMR